MKLFDELIERRVRRLAQLSSRRGLLKSLGGLLVGSAAIPLLPVARASTASGSQRPGEAGDPNSCDYWRYCAIDGYLCGCCGGSMNTCPPGTEMSPITWIGSCRNPADGRNYVISYNDCCGKGSCGSCLCQRHEGGRPPYRSDKSNEVNWCLGTSSSAYNCSTAIVVGIAFEEQ
jgi:methylamine dehydrogenase light chain